MKRFPSETGLIKEVINIPSMNITPHKDYPGIILQTKAINTYKHTSPLLLMQVKETKRLSSIVKLNKTKWLSLLNDPDRARVLRSHIFNKRYPVLIEYNTAERQGQIHRD